jgi:cell wall-associated NlpC family hydrolase
MNQRFGLLLFLAVLMLFISSCHSNRRSTKQKTSESSEANVDDVITTYSQRLGVAPSALKNRALYHFVEAWEGVPYKYGGVSETGVDCSGFVGILYRQVYQQNLPRTAAEMSLKSKAVKRDQLEEGDLVFFDIEGKKTSHVGVYLQNGMFIHASTSRGVIISSLSLAYYDKAFSHGGRV